jgi:hypothetical protein
MTLNGWLQILFFLLAIFLVTPILGGYMARVFTRQRTFLDPVMRPLERLVYRLTGVDETREMRWTEYSVALLLFSVVSMLVLYLMQRAQAMLPFNPQGFAGVAPDLAFNTAASFTTNTNWQAYSGESTMSYFTQMAGLAYHNFVSAATGIAVAIASRYKLGPIFTPPSVATAEGTIGTLSRGATNGGSNWPGGAYDPETHVVYLAASNAAASVMGLVAPTPDRSDMNFISGRPSGTTGTGLTVQGLSIFKPPYGTLTAINLDKGDIVWQVPHGETPDVVRNLEALKGMNIPRTGQPGFTVGTLVTKTLVIAGESSFGPTPSGQRGAMLRAYDKATGAEVGAVHMPAPQGGSPMTYMMNGRQYIVVAVSGAGYSGELIAYRLAN